MSHFLKPYNDKTENEDNDNSRIETKKSKMDEDIDSEEIELSHLDWKMKLETNGISQKFIDSFRFVSKSYDVNPQ